MQNYMFERFLERLSVSEYSEKFVVKGGMLIAAIVELDTRSTMDLDTALRNLPLTEEKISAALNSICKINLNDDVSVKGGMLIAAIVELDTRSTMDLDTALRNLPLTEEKISAALNSICKINLNDDVSTGDIITPSAVKYEFGGIFDEKQQNN